MTFEGEFALPQVERVVSGPGTVSRLGAELDRRGCSRAIVVTGTTLGRSRLLSQVTGALGDRCAGVFTDTRQHVPARTVSTLAALIRTSNADAVVSFGGGTPIDTAKAAIHAVLLDGGSERTRPTIGGSERTRPTIGGSEGTRPTIEGGHEALPHLAVPTTLSAGEFTAIAGITDEQTLIKRAISDPRLYPRVVITDPLLTLETPDWLWGASGIRALDHAVESIYSIRHHPFGDALATKGIALLLQHLPGSMRCNEPEKLSHRGYAQLAAWLSVTGIANAGFGLSHAIGHQIGPRWAVPHGVTSCVMLPHAMRFMAGVAPERFGPIAEGLGVPFDPAAPQAGAHACAERVAAFIAGLRLPARLRDAGVPPGEASQIADVVHDGIERAGVVGRAVGREEIAALLTAAY